MEYYSAIKKNTFEEPLDESEEENEKAGLKLNIQKLRSWYLIPSLHGK